MRGDWFWRGNTLKRLSVSSNFSVNFTSHHNFASPFSQRHFEALGEAVDVDSEAYCRRRSGVFWRMRASLGLACAQATTLCTQVFGKRRPRSRAGRPRE